MISVSVRELKFVVMPNLCEQVFIFILNWHFPSSVARENMSAKTKPLHSNLDHGYI